ncbi:hypothetical protein ACQP1P_38500 [Dactylosporangium sp. CA-052675]|uniref:hypothetical protein n=1 Tax=Dactylosporangium sp. CA-052675 TaxID=3239927 RepID=UPI003D8BCD6A
MAAFAAGGILTAAGLIRTLPFGLIKQADESVNNSTTVQGDDELNVPVAANTTYKIDAHILATDGTGTSMDLKVAWTQPSGSILSLAVVGPHTAWNASSGALEVEWNGWQNDTGTLTATRSFGSSNSGTFSYHFRGTISVGSTAGFFRLQWAQNTATVGNLTVKAGSSLILTPILA